MLDKYCSIGKNDLLAEPAESAEPAVIILRLFLTFFSTVLHLSLFTIELFLLFYL